MGILDTPVAGAFQGYAEKDARGLRNFRAALGQRHDTPVRILGLGHSFMEGQGATANNRRWWERFQQILRNRYPLYDGSAPSGRGFIPAFYKASTMVDPTKSGATVEVNTFGPGGRTLFIPVAGTLTYNLTGTTVRVWYLTGPTTGTFTVKIDGVDQTPFNTSNAAITDGVWQEYSLGAAGAHTVVITASVNAIYISGVEEFNGNESKGFQINEFAHAGFKISDYFNMQVGGGGDVDQLWNIAVPDLVIIEFGVNEWVLAGAVSPATFRTNLDTLVTKVRSRAPLASILYVIDYQDLGSYTYQWQEFVRVYYEKAATDVDSAVLDLTKRMPTASIGTSGIGLSISDGHPSDKGHAAYAEYVANFIAPR